MARKAMTEEERAAGGVSGKNGRGKSDPGADRDGAGNPSGEKASREVERLTEMRADNPADVRDPGEDNRRRDGQDPGEADTTSGRDEEDSGPKIGQCSEQADGTASGEADGLTRLREEASDLRERLAAAEEENRRLTDDCRQARAERDEAVRREEALGRETALRRYLAEKGLSGDAADIALRGLRADAGDLRESGREPVRDPIRVDGDGNLTEESRAALDGLMEGPYRPLFRIGDGESGGVRGIALDNPPLGAGIGSMSREEILSIRDGTERRRAIADNPGVFGL